MLTQCIDFIRTIIAPLLIFFLLVSCSGTAVDRMPTQTPLVELIPIAIDPKHAAQRKFGAVTLLSAFRLTSKDKRFGGLSGMSIGTDGNLYAVSDHGYWMSASMRLEPDGALKDLVEWRIAPILTTTNLPVSRRWRDAEALAQARDGSFLVAFEGFHRIWRYSPLPKTFESTPVSVHIPSAVAQAPSNGGIEALATLADGRLLIIAEELENPDGSVKAWLIDDGQFTELAYLPAKGFRVTDCAALNNGDVLVLERRYVPLGIMSARLTRIEADRLDQAPSSPGKNCLNWSGRWRLTISKALRFSKLRMER